jgi:hypothetical protein
VFEGSKDARGSRPLKKFPLVVWPSVLGDVGCDTEVSEDAWPLGGGKAELVVVVESRVSAR